MSNASIWNPPSNSSADLASVGHPDAAAALPHVAVFWVIGLLGGLAGGLLGIGGGSVIAPLLLMVTALRPAQVAGTTLATVLVISAVGSGAYASLGHLNLGLIWPIAVGSVAGSVAGALLSRRLSMRLMLLLFVLILPYFALKEFWPGLAAPSLPMSLVALVGLGAVTGLVSGLLGIGGASLVVPSLVAFFLIDHHAAQGIAIGVALADSLAGVATHAGARNIRYRLLLNLAVPACVAALGGAFLADSFSVLALRNIFGAFVVGVWLLLLVRLVKDPLRRRWAALVEGRRARAPRIEIVPGPDVPRRRLTVVGGLMNAMLLFVPLAVVGQLFGLGAVFVFVCSALACVPLSYRLGQSTEVLGARLGPVSGGLINATFGNAAEVILSITALSHGLFLVVRTTLIGSILGQLLLVLGTALLLGGLKHKKLVFSQKLVQVNFTLMVIALVAIGLPSFLLTAGTESIQSGLRFLTPALCTLLIIVYGVAVFFSLKEQPEAEEDDGSSPAWTAVMGLLVLAGSTGGLILISELLVGSILPFVETTGVSQIFIGLILIPLFSNVVDHIVAVSVAMKNKMDLSLTISIGSAAQISCLVLPIIVLVSSMMGQPLGIIFTPAELIPFAAGLLLMIPVLLDGESNWVEGAQLLTSYAMIAMVLWIM